jgi:hypothetical protein
MWRRLLVLAGSVVVLISLAFSLRPENAPARRAARAPTPASPTHVSKPSQPFVEPASAPSDLDPNVARAAVREVSLAKADRTEEGTLALIENLKSDDMVVVAEAADALVARRATSAIGTLAAMDIHATEGIAPSIIHALGRLGEMGDGDERRSAVDRLLALLDHEKRRNAPDSSGNLLHIYEALGATGDSRAAPTLERELEDDRVGIAPKVVIVQALARIGAPSSRPVVVRARSGVAAIEGGDAYEMELRQDLLNAMDTALTTLP